MGFAMAFCEKCGAPLEEGSKFCEQCGTRVEEIAETVSMPRPAAGVTAQTASFERQVDDGGEASYQPTQRLSSEPRPAREPYEPLASYEPPAATPVPAKKRSMLPIILGVVGVTVIVVIALYVVPLFIPHPHDPNEGKPNLPPTSVTSSETTSTTSTTSETTSTTSVTSTASTTSTSNTTSTTSTTTTSSAMSETTSSTPTTTSSSEGGQTETTPPADSTPQPETNTSSDPEPQPTNPIVETPVYNTYETPTLDEFTSWFSNDLMNGNAPAGITRITSLDEARGGWKAFIYNYAIAGNEYSMPTEELLNIFIGGTEAETTLTFDWYYTRIGGDVHENNTMSSVYNGSWSLGRVEAIGGGKVVLSDFWEQDGHQYGIGRMVWPDGVDGTIALVRP